MYEIGHALGLGHASDPNAVTYPSGGASNQALDQTDIAGIQSLYGCEHDSDDRFGSKGAQNFQFADTSTSASGSGWGRSYSGPVSYLKYQYIWQAPITQSQPASPTSPYTKGLRMPTRGGFRDAERV